MPTNEYCDCAEDGFCPRYQREMAGRLRQICQGVNVDKPTAALYRELWRTQAAEQKMTHAVETTTQTPRNAKLIDCPHAGLPLIDDDLNPVTRDCPSCQGRVRMKVFTCSHPETANEVTLQDCRVCPYRPGQTQQEPLQNIVIRFMHGLGDAVMFTAVLAHLKQYRPYWRLRIHAAPQYEELFAPFVHEFSGEPPRAGGDGTFDVKWSEGNGSHGTAAATKVVRCLEEEFKITPDPALMRYYLVPSAEEIVDAEVYLETLPKRSGIVAIHAAGAAWGSSQKDIPDGVLRAFYKWLYRRGWLPLLLDVGKPAWAGRKVACLSEQCSPGFLAALLDRVSLNVMIDSGPQKVAMTTDTPLLAVWRQAHPYHYLDDSTRPASQLHLISKDHERYLQNSYGVDRQCNVDTALDWLRSKCPHHIYEDLFSGLCIGAEALLADVRAKTPVHVQAKTRNLLLHCGLPPGDVMTLTAAVESLHRLHPGKYRTAISTGYPEIWENNPHVVEADGDFEKVDCQYHTVHQSGNRPIHFISGYWEFLADYLGIDNHAIVNKPFVYLTQDEIGWMNQVTETTKNNSPYWILNAGVKTDYTAKQWPYYQELVDLLKGRVRFAQVGLDSDIHKPLRGVVNLIGKTSIRALLRLVYHCQGIVSGTSLLMHVGAAFDKAGVILAGGREPRLWNSYPTQIILNNVGSLDCCREGGCWRSKVLPTENEQTCSYPLPTDPPAGKCMGLISPELAAEAVKSFLG